MGYKDDEGNTQKSAHCYKGTTFDTILDNHIMGMGKAGLELTVLDLTPEELGGYVAYLSDMKQPATIGRISKEWGLRWGADLEIPLDKDGVATKQVTGAVDIADEQEVTEVVQVLAKLVAAGKGASLIFYREEWERGCDVTGSLFPAEGFKVSHGKPGLLSMDRDEDRDTQGSSFFITLKEFPEMDQRWVVFGEIVEGMDVVTRIEQEFEGQPKKVLIKDCGVLK